jgi:GDP-L-fucose synthase
MKKITILGGFGFLGKNLQSVFEKSNYDVKYISRRNGYDLLEKNKIKEFLELENPDYILNCVAHTGSLEYVNKHNADIITNNLLMGINFWEILKDINFKGTVINPISNCTYPGDADVQKEDEWFNGNVHPSIISYGTAKKTLFMLNKCYENQYNIKTINIILPNQYGEYDYDDVGRVHALNGIIIRMLDAIKQGKKEFTIWGSGTPIREWGYMPDTARFIKYIIDENITNLPNPLNVGTGIGYTLNQIGEMIKESLESDIVLSNDISKLDGDPKKLLDVNLFNERFPNFVFTDLRQGISNTINYYKNRF